MTKTSRAITLAKRIKREPVMKAVLVTPLILAFFQVLRAFEIGNITDEQVDAIVTFATYVIPLLMGLWARSLVTPVDSPQNNEGEDLVTVEDALQGLNP